MTDESSVNVRFLVVDDDYICLSVIAAYLRTLNYEVTLANHPFDALSILRSRQQVFDLVLSDFHMPNMTGLELQKIVREEFNLPVVIMSADDSKAVILHCLSSGASFYIVKPVDPNDLKNVWQSVASKKKRSLSNSVTIEEIDNVRGTPLKDRASLNRKNEKAESTIPSVAAKRVKKKRKQQQKNKKNEKANATNKMKAKQKEGGSSSDAGKKVRANASSDQAKVIWTDDLHHRFLQAIDYLGWENAIPTRINDLMNIPGLTRENIASHLQKYRLFLRKVSQSGVDKLRDPKVASRLGVAPTLLSTIVERQFPPRNLQSSQQIYDHLVKLRGNTQDQPEETSKQRVMASDGFTSGLENSGPHLSMIGEATTAIDSDQITQLAAFPEVSTGNHSRNEALGSTSGSFAILDSSNEILPYQCPGNFLSQQTDCSSHSLPGDNGEDPLLTVIRGFDHLGANSFANIDSSSQGNMRQPPVNRSENSEASVPARNSPMVDYESADQDWTDFMDSLWRSNEDFSWD